MSIKKKALKFMILFILIIFLLSTGLISVLYLGGNTTNHQTEDVFTGDNIITTGVDDTESLE